MIELMVTYGITQYKRILPIDIGLRHGLRRAIEWSREVVYLQKYRGDR